MKCLVDRLVDELATDVSEHLAGLNIGIDDFVRWLRLEALLYRLGEERKRPSLEVEKNELRNYIKTLEKFIEYSQFSGPSPYVRASLWGGTFKRI